MYTSGTTAVTTSSDTAVSVTLTGVDSAPGISGGIKHVRIVNEGAAAGFFSTDGGTNWARLPAQFVAEHEFANPFPPANLNLKVKRIASGTNLSGVYVTAW